MTGMTVTTPCNLMKRVLRSKHFWIGFVTAAVLTGLFFAWELGMLDEILPTIPRSPALANEWWFTLLLSLLLSLNAGLITYHTKEGTCPIGTKSASGVAGILGAFTLICPVCIVLPASLFSVGVFFSVLAPFLPLMRVVAIVLLLFSLVLLRPKAHTKRR